MRNTADPQKRGALLSHDLPCRSCGHGAHYFLACSDECACVPPPLPGIVAGPGAGPGSGPVAESGWLTA